MFVGQFARAIAHWIDYVELRAIATRFHNERPKMNVGAQNVGAPGDDQLGMTELLGFSAIAEAERLDETCPTGCRTDGAVQPRSADPMKEPPLHAGALQQAHGARITVRQDRFSAVPGRNGLQPA